MASTTLRLIMEGDDLSLEDVGASFVEFAGLIAALDHELSVGRERSVCLRVAGLQSGSAIAEMTIEPLENAPDIGERIAAATIVGLNLIERQSKRPLDFPDEALERLRNLARLANNGAGTIRIEAPELGLTTAVTRRNVANLEVVLAQGYSIGAIEGFLDTISVHGEAFCTVYDAVSGRAVRCYFPQDFKERVVASLGQKVLVHGRLRRDPTGRPSQMRRIDELEGLGKEQPQPLVGIFAGMDQPTRDYLAEIRGE